MKNTVTFILGREFVILAFIDETNDAKFRDYLGLSCVIINSTFYRQLKNDFQNTLLEAGWDPKTEFKGSYLFSASQGCINIPIEKRIDIASRILALNTSNQNARMKFIFVQKDSKNQKVDYLKLLPLLLKRGLSKASKGSAKDMLSLHCDYRSDISKEEVHDAIRDILKEKGYTLFEDVVISRSGFHTVGILYADIVGYLYARIDTITNDSELFEDIHPEEFNKNGKLKKLVSSMNLINNIKKFEVYKIPAE